MNTFGRIFRVSICGESHSSVIGVLIDGVPAGLSLEAKDFAEDLNRRKTGNKATSPRRETDIPYIKTGVFRGYTTGSPLYIEFLNENVRSEDYSLFRAIPRPGHSDYVAQYKYKGFNDIRGGGPFSGRLTLGIVAAGVVAKKIIGNKPKAELIEIGGTVDKSQWDSLLEQAIKDRDSLGAIIECVMENPDIGLGEPFFDSVESICSHLLFSIPGVRAVEFGDGFESARKRGSQHNDCFYKDDDKIRTLTNHSGGINGGISNGSNFICRVAFKPSSSIGVQQRSLNLKTGLQEDFTISGRHDVCFALRSPVIVEAMVAIAFADFILLK